MLCRATIFHPLQRCGINVVKSAMLSDSARAHCKVLDVEVRLGHVVLRHA